MSTHTSDFRLVQLPGKGKKKHNFSLTHKAECVLLPSLPLAAPAVPENTELSQRACGGGLPVLPPTPPLFNSFLGRNKAVAALQLELQPKLLKLSILYIHTCLGLCSRFAFPARLYIQKFYVSFIIGTDFNRTNSSYWRDITPFTER